MNPPPTSLTGVDGIRRRCGVGDGRGVLHPHCLIRRTAPSVTGPLHRRWSRQSNPETVGKRLGVRVEHIHRDCCGSSNALGSTPRIVERPLRVRPRRHRHQRRPRQVRSRPRTRRLRHHGTGPHRRRRPDARPPSRRRRRHPHERPRPEHQQSVPLRHRRHRPRRPNSSAPENSTSSSPAGRNRCPAHPTCSKKAAKASNTATSPSATTWPTTASTTSSPTRPWACSPNKSTNKKPPTSPAPSRTPSPPPHTRTRPAPGKTATSDNEVVPVSIPQRKGDPIVFAQDEGIRADTTTESLGKLRPAFSKDGTITAGSASPISDGAAAVIVMSKTKAEELGLTWIAEIGAHGVVAGPDSTLQSQPARAIAKACAKEGIDPTDLDLVEINEAFAAVGIALHPRTRPRPRQGQRQRRRHRRRTPPRHVRRPHRPAPRPRTATPRRRHRRSRTLRRRRTRRRTHHPRPHGVSIHMCTADKSPEPGRLRRYIASGAGTSTLPQRREPTRRVTNRRISMPRQRKRMAP